MRKKMIGTMIVSLMPLGCASVQKSALMGMGVGAGAGAGAGAMVDAGPHGRERIRNTFVGAAVGTLIGAGIGYLVHGSIENGKKERRKSKMLDLQGQAGMPLLIPAKTKVEFYDDEVQGNRLIPAHLEYVIEEQAQWAK